MTPNNQRLEAAGRAIADLSKEILRLHDVIDKLLAHCGDPECMECGEIICPHGEPLHFHHDGCPSCTLDDDDEQ